VVERRWSERYRAAGVHIRRLDRSMDATPSYVADSYRLYHLLRGLRHDVVMFQDWQGLGFCSMVAKHCGLAFDATRLLHICHGPYDWLREANRQLAVDGAELASAVMERRSAELADAIVGPSQHLIDWMVEAGWAVPPERHVIPYFTAGDVESFDRPVPASGQPHRLTELVFFGRLEERKGVRIFVEALNRLGPDLVRGLRVTFLGREATFLRHEVTDMLRPEVRDALAGVTFLTDFDQPEARAYLQQPGRVALIPSLLDNSPNVVYECIEDGVSFLAADAGGIGELVAPGDRARTLFAPTGAAMAHALRTLIEGGSTPPPPRAAFDGRTSLAAWRPLLAPVPAAPASAPDDGATPLVTVVIAHHDQGELVIGAVESIAGQDYAALEIVIVDDGSTDPASIARLDQIEHHDFGRPLRIVRQENKYLGAARNTGVRAAEGELIVFFDDDDLADPRYVADMVRAIQCSGAAAVSCAIRCIESDADGRIPPDHEESVWVFLGSPAVHLGVLFNVIGGAAMLVRRDAFDAVGGFHEHHGVGHEDWDLLARLALRGEPVAAIPEGHYHYRVRPGSMLRSTPTFVNMAPVFASYEALLPPVLGAWPAMARGLQDRIDELALAGGGPPVPKWWRRDLTLLSRYFDQGGARLVLMRLGSRARRLTGGQPTEPDLVHGRPRRADG
jgi:glycosyltransferase involved in cell wall biosynthesis